MWPHRTCRAFLRILAFLLFTMVPSWTASWAQNENETVGFQTNHLFESGAFGESIDILNGGLNLSVPIGQQYQVTSSLGYGLTLSYSSKIWRADGIDGTNQLVHEGSVGLGFNLHLGRLYRDVTQAGNHADCKWYWVTPDGNEHPFIDESPSLPCDAAPFSETTDETYYGISGQGGYTIVAPDGTVYELNHLVQVYEAGTPLNSDLTLTGLSGATSRYNQNYGGWYVTKIWSTRAETAGESVTVTYDTGVGYEHVIKTIVDSRGRTITFQNECEPTAPTCATVPGPPNTNAPNRPAVRTKYITVPAFKSTPGVVPDVTARYDFTYEWRTVESQFQGENPVVYGPVSLLAGVDFPLVTNHASITERYGMTFTYAYSPSPVRGGEVIARTVPTGAVVSYGYGAYGYLALQANSSKPVLQSEARQVTTKTVTLDGEPNPATWTYSREAVENGTYYTNPKYVIVTDPLGNETKYYYRASRAKDGNDPSLDLDEGFAPEWSDGLNYLIEYHQGNGGARRLVRTETQEHESDGWSFGPRSKLNVRMSRKITAHIDDDSKTSTVAFREWDYRGHYRIELVSGDTIGDTRTTRTEYRGADPDRFLLREVSNGGTIVSRTENEYDPYGRVSLSIQRLILPATPGSSFLSADVPPRRAMPPAPGDVLTHYQYDAAGNVIQKDVGDQGIQDDGYPGLSTGEGLVSPKYRIRYTWADGAYLTTKELYEWVEGSYYTWKAIDRTRDGNTGLIFESRDSASQGTTYAYDELGRVKDIYPPAAEHPIQVEYVNIHHTTVRQGSPAVMGSDYLCGGGTGDYSMSCYEYDNLGRLTTTQKRPADLSRGHSFQTMSYNILGWKTFESEWLWPGQDLAGREFDYSDPADPTQFDPFGRVRRIRRTWTEEEEGVPVLKKQIDTEMSYFGESSEVTVKGIQAPDGTSFDAKTTYERDPWGRLVAVHAPVPGTGQSESYRSGGGDAFYRYDVRDNLIEVEIVNRTTLFRQGRSFDYDPLNRLRSSYNPESGSQFVTAYDPLGNVTESVDASGNRHFAVYDGAGRLVQTLIQAYQKPGASAPPVISVLENEYDQGGEFRPFSAGRLTTSRDYDDTHAWIHTLENYYEHASGRVTQTRHFFDGWSATEAVPIVHSYNSFGLVDALTYPEGPAAKGGAFAITYTYSNGYPTAAWDPEQVMPPDPNAQAQAAFAFNAAGSPEAVTTHGQVRTEILPDPWSRPKEINIGLWNGSGFTRLDYASGAYAYDGAGNIAQIGANQYGYDAANRLVQAVDIYSGTTRKQKYTYDDFGNMTQKDLYDGADQLLQRDLYTITNQTWGGNWNRILNHQVGQSLSSFVHDPRGNIVQGDGRAYEVDASNRVSTVRSASGTVQSDLARYVYDGASRRVRKEDAGADLLTFYVRDGQGRLLSEFRRTRGVVYTPEWVKHYIYLGDRLVGLRENLVPAPPGKITATINRPQHKVILTWVPAVQGEGYTVSNYKVYRRPNSGASAWELLPGSPSGTTYTDSTVTNNTVYQYLVTAVGSQGGESYGAGTLIVLAGDILKPNPPTGLAGTAGDALVDVTWGPNNLAELVTGYHVYRGIGAGAATRITQAPVRLRTFKDQGLANGTVYRYSVSAVDSASNESVRSDEISRVPDDYTPPDTPRRLRATADCSGDSTVTLTWEGSPSPEDVTYTVFREPAFPYSPSRLALATMFTDIETGPTTTYSYTIEAIDQGGNISSLSQPVKVTTRAAPGVVSIPQAPYALAEDGKVTLRANQTPILGTLVYRKRNVDQSCHAYEYLGTLSPTGEFPDGAVTNGLAWDYALSHVVGDGGAILESAFSEPAVAIPVARPRGVTSCIEELPTWSDGAVACPQDNTQRTPWRRLAMRWSNPPEQPYQPYVDRSEGPIGFFKGMRLYRYQGDYGSGPDSSTLIALHDDYEKGYCPSVPDLVCSGYGQPTSICPVETCTRPTDGAVSPYDGYGECSSDGAQLCMVDYDCAAGGVCGSEPVDPSLMRYGDERFYGQFGVTVGLGDTCLAMKAVYKVFVNGTWLTVESGMSDMLADAGAADPAQRCVLGGADVCDANLLPHAFDPEPNTLICPRHSTLPQVPAPPAASSGSIGEVTVTWAPPPAPGTCELVSPSYCYDTACPTVDTPPQYCAMSDNWRCRFVSPAPCSETAECSQVPPQTCVLNTDREISAYRLYVTEVDQDRHHFVRPAPTVSESQGHRVDIQRRGQGRQRDI